MRFMLSDKAPATEEIRRQMTDLSAGAYCSFEGWVRNHHLGKAVTRLIYEAYPSLAIKQGEQVLSEAMDQFDILDARAIHRTGILEPGDLAVWIGVTAAHRGDAFKACQYIIDTIKSTVPIWKHEFYADGTDVWVDPTDCTCSTTGRHEHE